MKIDYKKITIENIVNLNKTNYISEIVFDADSKSMIIQENQLNKIKNVISKFCDSIQQIINCIVETMQKICSAFNKFYNILFSYIKNRKITKRKFIKLLQANGFQRNEINQIIKNNKEPYTYFRLLKIIY